MRDLKSNAGAPRPASPPRRQGLLTRLLPEAADQRTRLAMLRLFFEQSGVSLAAAGLLIGVHVAYAAGTVPRPLLAAWAAVFLVQLALRTRWRVQVLRLADAQLAAAAGRWQARALAGSLSTGLLWSLALAMVFDAAVPSTQMYAAMLACITGVASINVMAPLPRAFVAMALPLALALAVLFLGLGTAHGVYSALLALVALAMASSLLLRHTRLLHESHAMRFEREALLAETQAAREAQARFLAAASHDLRQPVHALGLLAAQAGAELQGRRASGTAAQMQNMVLALDGLIGALLDVSRLDSGAVTPQPRPLPLARVFERLAPEFAVLADARGLQWRVRPSTLWVSSDEVQLERMLRNLLSNALKFTTRGGVLLAARRRGARVEIGVWDTGPGIAPEHRSRVFEEFVQLQNPGRDRLHGHGLGLAIVARLSRLLQHPVRLHSRPGRGSLFVFSAPEAQPLPEPAPARAPGPTVPLPGRVLALVEDDDAVREATASLLRTWGCTVWAGEGLQPLLAQIETARAAPGTTLPEAIISDWRLRDGDGLTAIAALRRATGRELPALLISGEALPAGAPPPQALRDRQVTLARKPLPAAALRAWLGAPLGWGGAPAPPSPAAGPGSGHAA